MAIGIFNSNMKKSEEVKSIIRELYLYKDYLPDLNKVNVIRLKSLDIVFLSNISTGISIKNYFKGRNDI